MGNLFLNCQPETESVKYGVYRDVRNIMDDHDTSISFFLNHMFEVLWPKLVPRAKDLLEDLTVDIPCFTVSFEHADLSKLNVEFVHVGVVNTLHMRSGILSEKNYHESSDESVMTLKIVIKVSGAPSLDVHFAANKIGLINATAKVETVDIIAELRTIVDPINEEIRIAFLQKPETKVNLKTKLPKIILNGGWAQHIAAYVLKTYSVDNPSKVPFKIGTSNVN